MSVVERTDTVTILDKPNDADQKARKYEDRGTEERVELLLQELAEQFSSKEKVIPTKKKRTHTQLTQDEEKYYEEVRNQASLSDKLQSAKDWYRILSASQKTYSEVKKIVGDVSRQPEEKVNANNVNTQLTSGSR